MPNQKIAWKRLALEVVVIVGSILLAFWIQAWWEGVQEQEERDALVRLIRADIAKNIAQFEIEQHDVRPQVGHLFSDATDVVEFADDLDVGLGFQHVS